MLRIQICQQNGTRSDIRVPRLPYRQAQARCLCYGGTTPLAPHSASGSWGECVFFTASKQVATIGLRFQGCAVREEH